MLSADLPAGEDRLPPSELLLLYDFATHAAVVMCFGRMCRWLQADLSDQPIKFYGAQYQAVYTSDNGYIVFGETFYPYDPSQFGTVGAGAPKVDC